MGYEFKILIQGKAAFADPRKNVGFVYSELGELGVVDFEYLGFVISESAGEMVRMQSVIEQEPQQSGFGAARCASVRVAVFVVG